MRKSKKRSGASSRPQPEPTLFIDRSLGKHIIADRLRAVGMTVEVHDDHLPQDAPDEEWIALVGAKGWVAITKDRGIRYRAAELEAIRRHAARVMVIRMKNATGPDNAELLVRARRRIAGYAAKSPAPFVAGIYADGTVKTFEIV